MLNKMKGYFEEINGKTYEELRIKVRDLIRSETKNQVIMMKNM